MCGKKSVKPLIPLPKGCVTGKLQRRIKRFTVEVSRGDQKLLAHTNNTGAMLGCAGKGATVLLSPALKPARKLPWTLERVWQPDFRNGGFWIGVNTSLPSLLFRAAFAKGCFPFTAGYSSIKREVACGDSRIDLCLEGTNLPKFWIECKNVSLVEDEIAAFPDAVSERALKHLDELVKRKRADERAAMFFLVQRPDCCAFAPADFIDREYAENFYYALAQGVEAYAYCLEMENTGASLGKRLTILGRQF